ncbi:hypothetical protein O9X98_14220 [Agrobacterium salinitolerans]|nr:hypothetical protein [Agrobacterium salinitolerans]
MQFKETGMGLFGWHDEDIGIFGGIRMSRLHPPGHLWCEFYVFDMAFRREHGSDRQVGKMELLVEFPKDESEPPIVRKLLNFEIDKTLRRNPRKGQPGEGLGRRAIEALARTIPDDIEILDIKPGAKAFWKKMGVETFPAQKRTNGTLKPAAALNPVPSGSKPPAPK